MKIKLISIDLDGTLLDDNHVISDKNTEVLQQCENLGIKRVITTGRSIFSFYRVTDDSLPIDYLIFSSGAGIMDFRSKKIIYENNLSGSQIKKLNDYFTSKRIDFSIQLAIPENHKFVYKKFNDVPDFLRRVKHYDDYAEELNAALPEKASQFIAILDKKQEYLIPEIKSDIKNLDNSFSCIRATSPLDGESIWFEVFPKGVSKGYTLKFLCEKLGISLNNVMSLGNDYNDADMLEISGFAYVVSNSPPALKKRFEVVCSNNDDALVCAFERMKKKESSL